MIRKNKLYVRPKKLYEKSRISEENALIEKYGLKNKREIWKTIAKVSYFRRRAKSLAKSPKEEQEVLFAKLRALGLKTNTIADVLALDITALLNRRLPIIVVKKGLANTARQARQFVTHRKVTINDKVITIPGYLVSVAEEEKIKVITPQMPAKKEEKEAAQ